MTPVDKNTLSHIHLETLPTIGKPTNYFSLIPFIPKYTKNIDFEVLLKTEVVMIR